MDRREKIKFLQDLQSNKITLDDLKPKKLDVLVGYGAGEEDESGSIFLINDIQVTENEYKEAERMQPLQTIALGYGPEEDDPQILKYLNHE